MDPRKNAKRGYAKRQQEREKARRQAAAQWQPENFPPKEEKVNTFWRSIIVVGLVCLTVLCLAGCFLTGLGGFIFSRPIAPVLTTEASTTTVAPTNTPEPTLVPTEIAATEAPTTAPTEAPVVVILPTNPSIEGKLGDLTLQGEDLDTVLGKRMTFTNRKIVVPSKAWNEVLTAKELKAVETTWVSYKLNVPEGFFARVFAGGIRQGTTLYNEGILMTLKPGSYEFDLRNGEIVIWYPGQDKFEQNDLVRIFDQIRNGNFDIHSELAFFATTTDLLPKIPADLVQKNKIEIVPSLDPTAK